MKLGNIHNNTIYCTQGVNVFTGSVTDGLSITGCFPSPYIGQEKLRYEFLNRQTTKRLLEPIVGKYQSSNIWGISDDKVIANVGRQIFRSSDNGRSWESVYELADSSPPKGVLPSALCKYKNEIYLAEYSLENEPARIIRSTDGGRSWSLFFECSKYRHFHGLYVDPYTGKLWGNTGDRNIESAIGFFENGEFVPIGSGRQIWRGVEIAFTSESILWGQDSTFEIKKPIFQLPRENMHDVTSSKPIQIGTTDSILFYLKTIRCNGTEWVIGSTSSQTGVDRTAPSNKERQTCPRDLRIIASSANSNHETWYELLSFERRYTIGDFVSSIPTTDAHAFIAGDAQTGLLINPYNTRSHNGDIIHIDPQLFDQKELHDNNQRIESNPHIKIIS